MASGDGINPNEVPMNDDQQVMSPSGAQTSSDQPLRQGAASNGIVPPPLRGQDMHDEVTVANRLDSAPTNMRPLQAPQPDEAAQTSAETELPSSSRAISSASARGFLMGPKATPPRSTADLGTESTARPRSTFLGGVAKAVQSIPTAVESLVMGHGPPGPPTQDVGSGGTGGFASAQSGSPEGQRQLPPVASSHPGPLLDELTLQRLNGLQASAPHLYPPEDPPSGAKPPSTSSSDIQAEVRRQVREYMLQRDDKALHNWIQERWRCSELERAQQQRALRFLGVDIYEVQDD